jgi:ssDNA-binding Zn-finger/Zn-ribbon topoisomerase 1
VAEISCPKCGSQMVILTDKEDGRRYYVCVNRPRCTGRIAVEEASGYVWGEERPVGGGAGGTWQQKELSTQSRAGTAALRLEEGRRWLRLIFRRSKREDTDPVDKDKVPVDEGWGDDWDREISEPKLPPYLPERPKIEKKQAASDVEETSKPRSPAAPRIADGKPRQRRKQASPGRGDGWGDDWDTENPAPGAVANQARSRMAPQAASCEPERLKMREVTHDEPEQPGALEKEAATDRKEPLKPRPKASTERDIVPEKNTEIHEEKKPSRRWWQRVNRAETSPEVKELPKTRQKGVPTDEAPLKKEEPPSPGWPRASIEEVPLKKEEPARLWPQAVPEREVSPQIEEPLGSRLQLAPKPEKAPEVKRSLKPRPRPQAAPKKAVSTKGKKPFRHWWQRTVREETAPEPKEPAKTRQKEAPAEEVPLKAEEPPISEWPLAPIGEVPVKKEEPAGIRNWPEPNREAAPKARERSVPYEPPQQSSVVPAAAPEIKEPARPVNPIAPKVYGPDMAEESLKPKPLKVVQSDLDARKKKRLLTIVIIAFILATLAVDGMICAVLLR